MNGESERWGGTVGCRSQQPRAGYGVGGDRMTIEKIDSKQILDVLRSFGRPVATLEQILTRLASRGRRLKGARKQVLGKLRHLLERGQVDKVSGG